MFVARGNVITLFLLGRGLTPIGAEKTETGAIEIYFEDGARAHLSDYMACKERLSVLNARAERGEATA